MNNIYYWTFQIETSRFGDVMGPSCDYVTEEKMGQGTGHEVNPQSWTG